MFKRVLLCYDGSEVGRRALKRGAELAILVRAQVYVLSIIPAGVTSAAVVTGAAGGIERAVCQRLSREAAEVLAVDRRFAETAGPHPAVQLRCDISDDCRRTPAS